MRTYISLGLLLSALPLLQGCVPAMLGTAGMGLSTIAEERSLGQVVNDTQIKAMVNAKWLHYDPKLSETTEIQVREGRVLLTGFVDKPQSQIDAVRLAWEVNGVREVIDETRLGKESFGNYAKDTFITAKLKGELLFDEHVDSVNYNIKTVDGTVYLIGIGQNQAEIDHVMRSAQRVSGVNK